MCIVAGLANGHNTQFYTISDIRGSASNSCSQRPAPELRWEVLERYSWSIAVLCLVKTGSELTRGGRSRQVPCLRYDMIIVHEIIPPILILNYVCGLLLVCPCLILSMDIRTSELSQTFVAWLLCLSWNAWNTCLIFFLISWYQILQEYFTTNVTYWATSSAHLISTYHRVWVLPPVCPRMTLSKYCTSTREFAILTTD